MTSRKQKSRAERLLVFGATGLIGSHIVRALLSQKDQFKQISIFTSPGTISGKPSEIQALSDNGIKIIVGNIEHEQDVKNAYEDIDTVISCVGRNMIAAQVMLIRLAAASDTVNWFLPSEYGTDIAYGPDSAYEKPHQNKLKVRAAIESVKDSLDYTYVVTGPYGDGDAGLYLSSNLGAPKTGSFDVKNRSAVLIGDGRLKIGLTMMKDVGKLVLAAILHPEEARNRALKVNSFYTTDWDIKCEFERQTGGQPWETSHTSLHELRHMEEEFWAAGNPLATLVTLRRIWAEGGTVYERTDNELIGARECMTTLEVAVADAIQKQSSSSQHVDRKLT